MHFRLWAAAWVAVLASATLTWAVDPPVASAWPEISSDVPPDPALVSGTLPNGFRYLILPNREPKDRVSLRWVVAVGSLHETEEERGIAHFVEHMVFRGTRAHPGDALTSELQRMGVAFGAENTAFTYYDHTTYHIDLPNTREETVRRGMGIFREYAEAVSFDPKFIELERGVVLSEKATRDTADYRTSMTNLRFLWPKSRAVERPPIGVEQTVQHCSRDQLVAFYDAWYRPERMALVVVGAIEVESTVRAIRETFGSLEARGPVRSEPSDLIPTEAANPDITVFRDPAVMGIGIEFEHPQVEARRSTTRADRVKELHRSLAFSIFHRRLERIAHESGDTLVAPAAYVSHPLRGWQLASFTASGRPVSWMKLAAKIEQEHRRAFQFGFTEAELETTRKEYREGFQLSLRTASSRRSEWLASELVDALVNGLPFVSPQIAWEEVREPLAAATPQDCRRAFRAAWENQSLHVFISTNTAIRLAEREVAEVLNRSREVEVRPLEAAKAVEFAYENFGAPGALVKDGVVADLDVRLAEFSNGVRLNFKSTRFEADLVHFQVRVGEGMLALPEHKPGLGLLAQYCLLDGGLRKHSAPEIRDLLAGHSLNFRFFVGQDAFSFFGYCSRRDLPFAMKMIAAYCSDARFSSDTRREAEASYNTLWADLEAAPGGPIHMVNERLMLNDRRFGVPWRREFADCSIADVAVYLEPQLKKGPIEMSVVGDVTWEEASTAVAQTLGALPTRRPRVEFAAKDLPDFKADRRKPYVYLTPARLKQTALAWYWPVPPGDYHHDRRCELLAEVVADRIRLRLRQECGTAYAPTAGYLAYEGLPAVSYFSVYAEVESNRSAQAAEIVNREMENLRTQGITEDEFVRAKQPFVRSREDDTRSNHYWCYTVLFDPQRRPEALDAARDRLTDLAAITRGELQKLAERFFVKKKAYFFVAEPGKAHAWKK